MKRHEWEFPYYASDLTLAAKKKLDHHNARLEWWQDQYNKKFEEIKQRGLTVQEHIGFAGGANAHFSSSYNAQPVIAIDNGLTKDFNDCKNKVYEHSNKIKEYDSWYQTMEAQPKNAQFRLLHEDWVFFFGK